MIILIFQTIFAFLLIFRNENYFFLSIRCHSIELIEDDLAKFKPEMFRILLRVLTMFLYGVLHFFPARLILIRETI